MPYQRMIRALVDTYAERQVEKKGNLQPADTGVAIYSQRIAIGID